MSAVVIPIQHHRLFDAFPTHLGDNDDECDSPVRASPSSESGSTTVSVDMEEEHSEEMGSSTDYCPHFQVEKLIEEWENESLEPREASEIPNTLASSCFDDEDSSLAAAGYGGLENMGNTCYLNAALQMIASLGPNFYEQLKCEEESDPTHIPLKESLLSVLRSLQRGQTVEPDAFKSQVDERSPLFVGFLQQDSHEFLTTLLDLLDEDYKKEDTTDTDGSEQEPALQSEREAEFSPSSKKQRLEDAESVSVDEVSFMNASLSSTHSFLDLEFADIETLLHGKRPSNSSSTFFHAPQPSSCAAPKCKLVGGRMSTSGVTLSRLPDLVDGGVMGDTSCTLKSASGTETENEGTDSDSETSAPIVSPIDDYFTTEVRVSLTCDSCKYQRSHTETFKHLSLEISSPEQPNLGSSVEEGLRRFFQPGQLQVKCEKCFCETAEQTTKVTKLPRAMLFHLKRFIVDVSPDYSSISYSKDQSPVQFEEELPVDDLKDFLAPDARLPSSVGGGPDEGSNISYRIRSIVNHIGASASCGHYTADAKRECFHDKQLEAREWTRFNDSTVSKLSSLEAVSESSRTAYMILYEAM